MTHATAQLRNLRQSPRKVRLVAELVKGKTVDDAVSLLQFTTKRASAPIKKLIESAQANARVKKVDGELVIRSVTVNEGRTLYRIRPAAQGQARRIRKRTSHIYIEVAEQQTEQQETKTKKEDKKPVVSS